MSRGLQQVFVKRRNRNTQQIFEQCTISLVIREIQTKPQYHFIPVGMAKTADTETNKCWWGYGKKETFIQCWWGVNFVQALWKTLWRLKTPTRNRPFIWPSNSTTGYVPKRPDTMVQALSAPSCLQQQYSWVQI